MKNFLTHPVAATVRLVKKLQIDYLKSRHRLPVVARAELAADFDLKSLIKEDCYVPPLMPDGPQHDDIGLLMGLTAALQPQRVLELGTAYGNTVANICKAAPHCEVFTVNALPEQISGVKITRTLGREEIGRVYRQHGFADQVTQIFANTMNLDLSPWLGQRRVDLAIIDACHDTSYVLNDFAVVEPFMGQGGIVLFHDTHPSMHRHLAGSYLACLLLRQRGYDIRHVAESWYGVWFKGGFPPSVRMRGAIQAPARGGRP